MSVFLDGIDPSRYQTIIFDCDGVILDSNSLKTAAFREVAGAFGPEVAEALVHFHVRNAGASRYSKFAYMLEDLMAIEASAERVTKLADQFARIIAASLRTCTITEGLPLLRERLPDATWMVVSGSDQTELRQLFVERQLAGYFDGGIFGSPHSKDLILAREREAGNLKMPALFIGDSRYDHEAATRAGVDFVFASGWTEFAAWREYVVTHRLPVIAAIGDLLATI